MTNTSSHMRKTEPGLPLKLFTLNNVAVHVHRWSYNFVLKEIFSLQKFSMNVSQNCAQSLKFVNNL